MDSFSFIQLSLLIKKNKIGNEYSGFYTMDNEYNEININVNIIYKNLM